MSLLTEIYRLLFSGGSRFIVADNRDGFLLRYARAIEARCDRPLRILSGGSLDLRIALEADFVADATAWFVFVPDSDFKLMDDVAGRVAVRSLSMPRFFLRYHWPTISNLSLPELEWLYDQRQAVNLSASETSRIVGQYRQSAGYRRAAIADLESRWHKLTAGINFIKPSDWAADLGSIMLDAIELKGWETFEAPVREFNLRFQDFLSEGYDMVANSSSGSRPPKTVTQVAPYIARQSHKRSALIVIDGMNLWQGVMLSHAIEGCGRAVSVDFGGMFAWLPSVTELSRQAIFKGARPSAAYVQSPVNEQGLWYDFWTSCRVPHVNVCYQHGGAISPGSAVTRFGYVDMGLDSMMHSATDFMYLYDDTRRWIETSGIIDNICNLLTAGFHIYITSDHGSVETLPFRPLSAADKAGATADLRYVVLPEVADNANFKRSYAGHVCQVHPGSRTFFAVDREIFSSRKGVITHGGTHFLEAIVPFITVR